MSSGTQQLVGESPQLRLVIDQIRRVAPTEASALLIGESGSGKELVARSIHGGSQRRDRAFIAINCGAVAPGLIEAELFGHERGSFTGATQHHNGVFERAHGGTLFLDEITEMPIELQVRLLRVLDTQRFFKVGGSKEIPVDVRVIAATNVCPFNAVRDGKLREDVLYRLAVFPIRIPPLRERGDDIELLAHHFLSALNASAGVDKHFSPGSLRTLREHGWPGNVRELRNAVERAHILGDELLELVPLSSAMRAVVARQAQPGELVVKVGSRLEDVERHLIEATLHRFQGNKRLAAQTLGCSLKTLYNKLNGYSHAAAAVPALAQQG
ncbi:MAG TPA: sigma-54 dependent transcriptional regulator [Steroidobacteraceae bacterium]|nr:sigma-54 dependent transcriptional regulator [Steroidobacteraceae bacterium]